MADGIDQRLSRSEDDIDSLADRLHDMELQLAEQGAKIRQFRKALGKLAKKQPEQEKRMNRMELRSAADRPFINLWIKLLIGVLIFVAGLIAKSLTSHLGLPSP